VPRRINNLLQNNLSAYAGYRISDMANLDLVIKELRQERDRIDDAIKVLASLNGNASGKSSVRTLSAAARQRISAAQKARWAKVKSKTTRGNARRKPRISAAGIARIRAAAKARWARVKAEKKK
jgi:hypothetical protein